MAKMEVPEGRRLAHYVLTELIAEGGMGVVHKAWDTRLERVVAVKLLHPEVLRQNESRARLLREARIASALNHPNIATIYGLEEADGQALIAMEFVKGPTLTKRLQAGPMELREVLDLAVEIADALAEAHADGVVHRDIKPDNLILTPRGHPKVMDFGLAKMIRPEKARDLSAASTRITVEGIVVGTVAYMSPEQAMGHEVGAPSDVFSFGLVLYEMLTRQAAFSGDSDVDLLYEIVHHAPRPIQELNPEVPADVVGVVEKCLAKEVGNRYSSGRDLCEDLKLARINLDIQRTRTLHTLFSVSREMTSILKLEPLLERVAALVKSLINYDMLGIFRVEEKNNRLEWIGGAGYDPQRARETVYRADRGLCGRAIRTREVVLEGDVGKDPDYYAPNGHSFASNLVVPLIHKDRVIGVLNMESQRPYFFTSEHITIMSTLAGPIAVAMENARLFEERHRHYLAMEMLHEIGREISSILDLNFLLDRVGELTRRVIDYELFTIFLLDSKTGRFTWRTAIGYDPEFVKESEFKLGEGIISRAVESKEATIVDDVAEDPDYLPPKTADGRAPRSELAVPLVVQDRVLGVLSLESVEPGHFRPEHAELMTILASQVAVAIENARLYRELHEKARAREEEAQRVRQRFESYVTPHIAEQIFKDPDGKMLSGERRPVTVLVADIRGFTHLSENLPDGVVVQFLQEFFSVMTHIIFKYEGTVDKFLGDAVMAFYGAPVPHDPRYGPSDPQRAVFAGLDMREAFARLRQKWWKQYNEFGELELCIGINTGLCLLGNMGSDKRVEYTTVGEPVNLAFCLCREAEPGEIRIGGRTSSDVHEDVKIEPLNPASSADSEAHRVTGLNYL